jgi:hypothetical protein
MPVATIVSAITGALLISLTIAPLFLLGSYQVIQYRGFGLSAGIIGTIIAGRILDIDLCRLEKHLVGPRQSCRVKYRNISYRPGAFRSNRMAQCRTV